MHLRGSKSLAAVRSLMFEIEFRRAYMPSALAFNSIHEAKKPVADRIYHNNGACSPGRDIPYNERRMGMDGYRAVADRIDST